MWCKLLKFDDIVNGKVNLIYDIPTTLHVIYRKVFEDHNDNEAREAAAEQELSVFKSRLTWLLLRYGLDKYVKVI